jgi:hypothetical protein
MTRLQEIIAESRQGLSAQQKAYGPWPNIASKCGENEVKEILLEFEDLAKELEGIEEWDGDSQDDIWRMGKYYSEILSAIFPRFMALALLGLRSKNKNVRRWVAMSVKGSPHESAIELLERAVLIESDEFTQKVIAEALLLCKSSVSWKRRVLRFLGLTFASSRTP